MVQRINLPWQHVETITQSESLSFKLLSPDGLILFSNYSSSDALVIKRVGSVGWINFWQTFHLNLFSRCIRNRTSHIFWKIGVAPMCEQYKAKMRLYKDLKDEKYC